MPDETPKPTETETAETTPLAEADLDNVDGGGFKMDRELAEEMGNYSVYNGQG